MTAYKDFIVDFPSRLFELYLNVEELAQSLKREVTLMLAVAESGIVVPVERLKALGSFEQCQCCRQKITIEPKTGSHPSGDRAKYPKAAKEFDELLSKAFLGSRLWSDANPGTWRLKEDLSREQVAGDIDGWRQEALPITQNKTCLRILTDIRNALAHGNIYVKGNKATEEIEEIVLLSCKDPECKYLSGYIASPSDFRRFLLNWFHFLKGLPMPGHVVT